MPFTTGGKQYGTMDWNRMELIRIYYNAIVDYKKKDLQGPKTSFFLN